MAGSIAPSTKAAVLKWMAKYGVGYSRAAKHFNISPGTIKSWQVRAKARAAKDCGPDEPSNEAGVHRSTTRNDSIDEIVRRVDVAHASATPPEPPREPAHVPPKSSARGAINFPITDRENLRGSVRRALRFLDSDAMAEDPKKAADMARTLQCLIAVAPDILTFEDRTSGADKSATANAEAENLASVFGVGK